MIVLALQPLMTDNTGQAIVSQLERMTSGEVAIANERSRAQGEEARLEGLINQNTAKIANAYLSGNIVGQPSGDYSGTIQHFRELNPKKSYLVWKNAFEHFPDISSGLKTTLSNQPYWYLEPCFATGEAETYEALGLNPYVILHSPSKTIICEWRNSTTLSLKYELANQTEVSENTNNISNLQNSLSTDVLQASNVAVGTPNGDYSGTFTKFGDLRANRIYLLWKNAISFFPDIDQNIKALDSSYYTVVPLLYSVGKNTYSEINIQTNVLLVNPAQVLLCYWSSAINGELHYVADLNNHDEVTAVQNSLNSLAQKAYQPNGNAIGQPSGEYIGNATSFGELNPNRCYLIWNNAIQAFNDIASDVKAIQASYFIVWGLNHTSNNAYSGTNLSVPVFMIFGRTAYIAEWGGGAQTLHSIRQIATLDKLTASDSELYKYFVGNGGQIGTPTGEYNPSTYAKFGDLCPNKHYLIWKNALNYFSDIDDAIKSIFTGFAIAVPFEYERNHATYSTQNTTVPILLFAYGTAVLADWSGGENGVLTYRFTIKNYDNTVNQVNNIAAKYLHTANNIVGSSSGEYTGSVSQFSELNPHEIVLIWKNAINAFPDVEADIKALPDSYFIIVPFSPLNHATWGETGLDNHLLAFCSGRAYHFQWQNNQLKTRGQLATESEIQNLQTTIQQHTTKIAANETAIANIAKRANNAKNLMLVAPNGSKYVIITNNAGQLISVPVIPRKISFIGNSLLVGMHSQFGMAATASNKDYLYIIGNHCGATTTRISGGAYENTTDVQSGRNAVDTICSQLDPDSDLVIIQLGDNSSQGEAREVMITNLPYLFTSIRNVCTRARVVWAGSWYGQSAINRVFDKVNELGYEYIDFTSVHTSANESRIGTKYTLDTPITVSYSVDSWTVSNNNVTINFTVGSAQYTQTVACDSYTSSGGVQVSITGREQVITQIGVASHPNDNGFAEIAAIMMNTLGIT